MLTPDFTKGLIQPHLKNFKTAGTMPIGFSLIGGALDRFREVYSAAACCWAKKSLIYSAECVIRSCTGSGSGPVPLPSRVHRWTSLLRHQLSLS